MADIVQLKTAEEIMDDILAEISTQTSISDENLGAITRQFAYAAGVELDELYYQLWKCTKGFYIYTATGTALDNRASDYKLTRNAAAFAIGTARFTGPDPAPGSTTIPQGTKIAKPATADQDEIVFQTTQVATITAGNTTVDAPIQALVAGEDGNLAASTITYIKDTVSGVTSVTNPSATVLGSDEEDDATLRERIIRTLDGLSRGTVPSIKNGALDFEIQQVTLKNALPAGQNYIEVAEDLNLYPFSTEGNRYLGINGNTEVVLYAGINTGVTPHRFTGVVRAQKGTSDVAHELGSIVKEYVPTGDSEVIQSVFLDELVSIGHINIYLYDGTASGCNSDLLDLVEKRLRGDGTDRDPGYRGGGITLTAIAASPASINVSATISVLLTHDITEVKTNVQTAVTNLLNAHDIGQDVQGYEIAQTIMNVEGVDNVTALTINSVTFDGTTAADIGISNASVARAGTITIT